MIAALERAYSLERHAKQSGAPRDLFMLLITKAEAWELLNYLRDNSKNLDQMALHMDIEIAKRQDDPWLVLQHFDVCGFTPILREESLH